MLMVSNLQVSQAFAVAGYQHFKLSEMYVPKAHHTCSIHLKDHIF